MEHKELLRRLRTLSAAITKNVRHVNLGGCGVVAGLVGRELKALGIMVEVVTPCGQWVGKPAAIVRSDVTDKTDPENWGYNGLSRTHLAVRMRSNRKTYTWDSDGLLASCGKFGKDGYRTTNKFGDGLSVDECLTMCAKQRGWNRRFDRKQIPLLKHLVKHHLVYGL